MIALCLILEWFILTTFATLGVIHIIRNGNFKEFDIGPMKGISAYLFVWIIICYRIFEQKKSAILLLQEFPLLFIVVLLLIGNPVKELIFTWKKYTRQRK